jgi:hypothetical protein
MMPSHNLIDLVTFIGNIALTISVLVAVVFGMAQVRTAAADRRERLTLETLRYFQTREFAELIRHITIGELPKTPAEVRALPAEEYLKFVQLAQLMESLGILVAEGFIDIKLVDKTLGSFVTSSWEKYRPVFLLMRASETDPDPWLGEYFQWLSELIEKRMRESPRKPFYLTGALPPKR